MIMDDRLRPTLRNLLINGSEHKIAAGSDLVQLKITLENVILIRFSNVSIPVKPNLLSLQLMLPFSWINEFKEITFEGAFEEQKITLECLSEENGLEQVLHTSTSSNKRIENKRFIVHTSELKDLKQMLITKKITYTHE